MRVHQATTVMARITIQDWHEKPPEYRFREMLQSDTIVTDRKGLFDWVFGDFQEIKLSGTEGSVFFGRLGKVRKEKISTFYDEKNHTFIKDSLSKRFATYSNFVIHPVKHIIVFEEKKPDISISQFQQFFSSLYLRSHGDFSNIRVEPIVEIENIFDKLNNYDKIIKIDFDLFPSNPDDSEEFRSLDQALRATKAKKTNIKMANDIGLDIQSALITQGLHLSAAGYGDYKIDAVKGDKTDTIKSKDNIRRITLLFLDEPPTVAEKFYSLIKTYLEDVEKRKKK